MGGTRNPAILSDANLITLCRYRHRKLHDAARSIYGERSMEANARRFEIGLRQAEKHALVWKTFFAGEDQEENVNVDVFSLQKPGW